MPIVAIRRKIKFNDEKVSRACVRQGVLTPMSRATIRTAPDRPHRIGHDQRETMQMPAPHFTPTSSEKPAFSAAAEQWIAGIK
jgi:hypothetical protein